MADTSCQDPSGLPPPRTSGNRDTKPFADDTAQPPAKTRAGFFQLLLAPTLFFINFFLFDAILPTDTFATRYRKIAIGMITAGSTGYCFCCIQLCLYPEYPALWVVVFGSTVPAVSTSVMAFVYIRCTKTIPDWVFLLATVAAIVSRIPWVLVQSEFDEAPMVFVYVLVLLGGQAHKVWTAIAFGVAAFTVMLNSAMMLNWFGLATALSGILFPVWHPVRWFFVFMPHLMLMRFTFFVSCAVLVVLFQQLSSLIRRAESGVTMSREIAEKLQKYDTEGASAVLQQVRTAEIDATVGGVDESLLHAFEGIIENLDKYRPFLPNYLLQDSQENTSADAHSVPETDVDSPIHLDDEGGAHFTAEQHTKPSESNPPHRVRRPTGASEGDSTDDLALTDINGTQSDPTMISPLQPPTHSGGVTMPVPRIKVVACVVAVTWLEGAELTVERCNEIVSLARGVAVMTHASLHSFIGDRLVATWNATKHISKPEARACAFSLRLKAVVNESALLGTAVSLHSMTSTRSAQCCRAGDSKLRLFACSSVTLWRTLNEGLRRAEQWQLMAVDGTTRDHVAVDFICRGFATLPKGDDSNKPNTSGLTRLYKLIAKRDDDDRDQEWMYALESQGKSPDEQIHAALEMFAHGQAEAAWQRLQSIAPDCEAMQDPCVQSLLGEMATQRMQREHPSTT